MEKTMEISDFFVVCDKYLSHIRSRLSKKNFLAKKLVLEENRGFFDSFSYSKVISEAGKEALLFIAVQELKKSEKVIHKMIEPHLEQIRLTNITTLSDKHKRKYNKEQQDHIDRISDRYTPKFPKVTQLTLNEKFFNENGEFIGFKTRCLNDKDTSVTKIADVYLVRMVTERTEFYYKDKDIFTTL